MVSADLNVRNNGVVSWLSVMQTMIAQLQGLRMTCPPEKLLGIDDDILVAEWVISRDEPTESATRFMLAHNPGAAYRLTTHVLGWRVPHGR